MASCSFIGSLWLIFCETEIHVISVCACVCVCMCVCLCACVCVCVYRVVVGVVAVSQVQMCDKISADLGWVPVWQRHTDRAHLKGSRE